MSCENKIGLMNWTVDGKSYRAESEGVTVQMFDDVHDLDDYGRVKFKETKPYLKGVMLVPKGLDIKTFASLCDGVVVFEERNGTTFTGTGAMFVRENDFEYDLSDRKMPFKYICDRVDQMSNVSF